MSTSFVLKIKFGEDMRRISIERIPSFDELVLVTKNLFKFTVNPFIKYEDDERDLVTITSDLELREAFSVATKSSNVLKLFVSGKDAPTSAPQVTPQPQLPGIPAFDPASLARFLNPEGLYSMLQGVIGQGPQRPIEDITKMLNSLGLDTQLAQQPAQLSQLLQTLLGKVGNNPVLTDLLGSLGGNPYGVSSPKTTRSDYTKNNSSNNNNNNNNNSNNNKEHTGVACDGCQQNPITGIRFKCTVCDNYDLCEKCEAKGATVHDPNHPVIKMTVPLQRPQFGGGRGCPYKRGGFRGGFHGHFGPQHHGFQGRHHGHRLLARFVQDVTVPDGTVVAPESNFTKIWRVRNEGEIAWPDHTVLTFAGGEKLGACEIVPVVVSEVAPGQEVDVSVDFVAPSAPGRYISYWKLSGAQGFRFGQRMWVDINVDSTPLNKEVVAEKNETIAQEAPAEQPCDMLVEPFVIVEPEVSTTPQEVESLRTLVDMGFKGDLLSLLRKHNGDVLVCIRELLN